MDATSKKQDYLPEGITDMKKIATAFRFALAFVLALDASQAAAQTTPKCRPADAHTANLISHLVYRISATDPRDTRLRDSVYKIPVVASSQITVVNDERVCGKLIEAYSRDAEGRVPVSLYVIKLGTKHYAVMDPGDKAGEFSIVLIYNSKYVRVGGMTG